MKDNLVKKKQPYWQGRVVSNKMDKTIVVLVETVRSHKLYGKKIKKSKKYKVHDSGNKHQIGDVVKFVATRPISRGKRWQVLAELGKLNS